MVAFMSALIALKMERLIQKERASERANQRISIR
jgi:hypothetical protein